MSAMGTSGTSITLHVRLGPIARWAVTATLVLTAVVAAYAAATPAKVPAATVVFFAPLVVALGVGTVAMWRARLDLGPTEIRRTSLWRTRVVPVADVERVAMAAAPNGSTEVQIFIAGRALLMKVDLRYWERAGDVRAYFEALSAQARAIRHEQEPEARPEDAASAREARHVLMAGRGAALVALAVMLGLLGVPAAVAAARGSSWAIAALAAAVVVAGFAVWFGSAVPRRWFESTQTLRSDSAVYAEVMPGDLRRRDLAARAGLRSDGRLEVTRGGLDWSARAGDARLSFAAESIDDLLVGPASWDRWFVVTTLRSGPSCRFYVIDPDALGRALEGAGIPFRMLAGA